ncbi:hypothetical protein [Buchnera aphidicola]|uniref:hypothetical protein n=1 Tax=Buchnera aphidicola TaxID=9 RepID=UPI001651AA40|nr:hypothetical protein [Buchnera aphidicola (Stegophylla sp.)]
MKNMDNLIMNNIDVLTHNIMHYCIGNMILKDDMVTTTTIYDDNYLFCVFFWIF